MSNTPQLTMELTGPAANRNDDPELTAIGDFQLVSLEQRPNQLIATVNAPASPGEVDEYHDCILYLDRIGFSKLHA